MSELSAAAERTRRAILLAGVELLAANPAAPLTDIAERAGVARSTFHRYFADRAALKGAIGELANIEWRQALTSARLADGTGLEACARFFAQLMDSLDVLFWWMSEAGSTEGEEEEGEEDHLITAAIHRGHRDGSIDPALSVDWIDNLLWALLYSVRQIAVSGLHSAFDIRQQAMRSLIKTIAADPQTARASIAL